MNESVEIDGIIYKVGQKIKFYRKSSLREYTGIVGFGIYDDDEDYSTHEHIGFYVEYTHYYSETEFVTAKGSLVDVVRIHHGKVVENS